MIMGVLNQKGGVGKTTRRRSISPRVYARDGRARAADRRRSAGERDGLVEHRATPSRRSRSSAWRNPRCTAICRGWPSDYDVVDHRRRAAGQRPRPLGDPGERLRADPRPALALRRLGGRRHGLAHPRGAGDEARASGPPSSSIAASPAPRSAATPPTRWPQFEDVPVLAARCISASSTPRASRKGLSVDRGRAVERGGARDRGARRPRCSA